VSIEELQNSKLGIPDGDSAWELLLHYFKLTGSGLLPEHAKKEFDQKWKGHVLESAMAVQFDLPEDHIPKMRNAVVKIQGLARMQVAKNRCEQKRKAKERAMRLQEGAQNARLLEHQGSSISQAEKSWNSLLLAKPWSAPGTSNGLRSSLKTPATHGQSATKDIRVSYRNKMASYADLGSSSLPSELRQETLPDVLAWTAADVADWASSRLGLPLHVAEVLKQQDVDGCVLLSLSEEDLLRNLGMSSFGLRRRLLIGIAELRAARLGSGGEGRDVEEEVARDVANGGMSGFISTPRGPYNNNEAESHKTGQNSLGVGMGITDRQGFVQPRLPAANTAEGHVWPKDL
jgi:hypothetical protein